MSGRQWTACLAMAYTRGGYRIFKGEGPKDNVGQKARMNFATWGTFSGKFPKNSQKALPGALLCDSGGQPWQGGGAMAPFAPSLYPPLPTLITHIRPIATYKNLLEFSTILLICLIDNVPPSFLRSALCHDSDSVEKQYDNLSIQYIRESHRTDRG